MFHEVDSVRALLVLSLFNTLAWGVSQDTASEYDSCEDLREFYSTIQYLSPSDALKLITSPLTCENCPIETYLLYDKLGKLVTQGLNIKPIIANLPKIKSLNRFDILITTLMAIAQYPKLDINTRIEIDNAVLYLLNKRYLGINVYPKRVSNNRMKMYSFVPHRGPGNYRMLPRMGSVSGAVQQRPRPDVNPQNNACLCQTKMIDFLLDRITELKNRMGPSPTSYPPYIRQGFSALQNPQRLGIVHPTLQVPTSTSQTPTPMLSKPQHESLFPVMTLPRPTPTPANIRITSESQPRAVFPVTAQPRPALLEVKVQNELKTTPSNMDLTKNLLRMLPQPRYPKEKQMFEKFKVLLQEPEVKKIINGMDLSKYPPDEVLSVIINTVMHTIKTKEVQEVFAYYLNYKEAAKNGFNYGNLLEALPVPRNLKEQTYYNATKRMLLDPDIYNLKLEPSFTQSPKLGDKMLILIQRLLNSDTITPQLREALHYYFLVLQGKRSNIHFENLVSLLPPPTNDEEKKKFDMFKNLLESNDIYILMRNATLGTNSTSGQLLKSVFRNLIDQNNEYSEPALYYRNLMATQKYGFNYYDLLKILPQTEETLPLIQIFNDYFQSDEFEAIIAQLNLKNLSDADRLLQILEAIQKTTTNINISKAAASLLQKVNMLVFFQNMQKVIDLIPPPKTELEQKNYVIVKSFLLSNQAYPLLGQIDTTVFPHNKLLLEFIFKTVAENENLDQQIRDAFEYYVDLTEKLESIEFITRKEIKKNFKLTEIFTDTLDLKSLTLLQKNAFKQFFKYISEIKPDAMSKFDNWDEAKTRGEFMKLLFKYFLDSPTTSPDIKESINVLNPLVKMDGKGALPP